MFSIVDLEKRHLNVSGFRAKNADQKHQAPRLHMQNPSFFLFPVLHTSYRPHHRRRQFNPLMSGCPSPITVITVQRTCDCSCCCCTLCEQEAIMEEAIASVTFSASQRGTLWAKKRRSSAMLRSPV